MPSDPALADLHARFGARVSVAKAVLAEHAQSESLATAGRPDAVICPPATDEVAALARWSACHPVPLIGWGAGPAFGLPGMGLTGRSLRRGWGRKPW